ncbi:MAG: sugar ABC transporter permease [Chloroflexi bacterium]|nr:sugar ABC transporter permease [Chloroflexota bacterium]
MRKKRWVPWVLVGPALLIIVLTTIYPLIAALYFSFHKYKLRKPPQFAIQFGEGGLYIDWSLLTLDNYALAFRDSRFINSLEVTFWFTVISVALSVVIGLGIAVIVQKGGRLHTLTKVLLIFPFAVSPALKGYSWRFMLNENYGIYDLLIDSLIVKPINFVLSIVNALPLVEIPLISESIVWLGDKFWALFMLAMSETWGWAPLIALMFVGALGSIDEQIFEAARIDGANRIQIFFRVTLPLLRPVILIVTMLKTIFSLKMFDQVVTMTGGGPVRATQTINYYIHQVGFVRGLDIGYASAQSYILVVVLTICAALYVSLVLNRD